ncbi:hypothetical protein H920_12593 [Fukomys damarensis]|uniref:Uncharacterized protein n=1 Tax=Fukomys damarensis TaxID=885580 RepID=A0A091D4R2_FUKDA|nr:hypothetical protein H920_12593 [Fukomys damarensis]
MAGAGTGSRAESRCGAGSLVVAPFFRLYPGPSPRVLGGRLPAALPSGEAPGRWGRAPPYSSHGRGAHEPDERGQEPAVFQQPVLRLAARAILILLSGALTSVFKGPQS